MSTKTISGTEVPGKTKAHKVLLSPMLKSIQSPTKKFQEPQNPNALLSVQEARQLLNAAWSFGPPPCAAYFILRTWGGLRGVEVRNLDIGRDLFLEEGLVKVNANSNHCRLVKLTPNVIKMLKILQADGQLTPAALNPPASSVTRVTKKAIGRTDRNIMRLTALTYHFAAHRSLSETCAWGGITAPVYSPLRSPTTMEDAAAFWALLPDGVA